MAGVGERSQKPLPPDAVFRCGSSHRTRLVFVVEILSGGVLKRCQKHAPEYQETIKMLCVVVAPVPLRLVATSEMSIPIVFAALFEALSSTTVTSQFVAPMRCGVCTKAIQE